ncbi:hypothetical protein [Clostridium tyrobutyricum]|uniref:hypothetical protein n=1 Tax=Clostridium tyrobutyricum TaxID=1519 RepID=UPI0018ABDD83|nr:hypothetical protein [Clostridium tyrobutyricum]
MGKCDLLNELTVKIEYDGSFASGCVYNSSKLNNSTYIFTAKHTFATDKNFENEELKVQTIEKQDIELNKIKISRHISRSKWDRDFKVLDIFLADDEVDFAIIKMNKKNTKNNLKIMYAKADTAYEVSIFGYPKRLFKNESSPAQILNGNITYVSSYGEIEFEIEKKLDTFEDAAKGGMDSFSGSGIFRCIGDQVYLLGIYTKLKEIQNTYGALMGESISCVKDIRDIKDAINLNLIYEEEYVNNKEKFFDLSDWEKECLLNSPKWVNIDSSNYIINIVKKHFVAQDNNNILYIVGNSGTGKTRTVLEACRSDDKFKKVMYFRTYDSTVDVLTELKDSNERFYIVIDDICTDEWRKLNGIIKNKFNMRVVSIGVSPKNKIPEDLGIIFKKNPDNYEIKDILENNSTGLNKELINKIIELSESDLRFALLIKDVFMKERNISVLNINEFSNKYTSIESIYNRIIGQYNPFLNNESKFKDIYSKLCILIETGFNGTYKREMSLLNKYFNINQSDSGLTPSFWTRAN